MRQHPEDRAASILNAAIVLAERPGGLAKLTRGLIAQCAKCAPGLVSHYFGDMRAVRSRVIHSAVNTNNFPIIAQALGLNLPEVASLSESFKRKALVSLS